MPIANFEALCAAFGEMSGCGELVPAQDAQGSSGVSVRMRDVWVTLSQLQGDLASALALVELGPVPEELAFEGWEALLKLNMQGPGWHLPVFTRNPDNGEAVLVQRLPLWQVSPSFVASRIDRLVDLALQWREDHFLLDEWNEANEVEEVEDVDALQPVPPPAPKGQGATSIERFESLHHAVLRLLGEKPDPLVQDAGGASSFDLMAHDLQATVIYAPHANGTGPFVMLNLGRPPLHQAEGLLTRLMEANFAWMMQPAALVGSCHPLSGELFVQFPYPLDQADPENLLARIDGLAGWWVAAVSH